MLLRSFKMSEADIRQVVGSDFHLDEYTAYPDMFGHLRDAHREATLLAKKYKARLILNGDTTNPLHGMSKNSVIDNVYDELVWSASELAEVGQEEDINEGNHGRGARGTRDHVETVFGSIPGVNFMHDPSVKEIKAPTFSCYNFYVPYQDERADFIKIARGFGKEAEKLRRKGHICQIFTHQWFQGQKVGMEEPAFDPSEEMCWNLPSNLFEHFHVNFNGHLHCHQVAEIAGTTSVVVGAPIQHRLGDTGQDRGVLLVAITKKGVAFRQHVFDQFPRFERVRVTAENIAELRKKDWSKTYLKMVVDDINLPRNEATLEGFNANRMMPAEFTLPPVQHDRLDGMTSESPKDELLWATNKALFGDLDPKEMDRLLKIELKILEECKQGKQEDEAVLPEGKSGTIKFRRLHGENIGPYESFELPLDGVGVTVITAPNGSGKTSLLDSFSYALFGNEAVDEDADSIINDRVGKNCLGETEFDFAGETYSVQRPRKHKTLKKLHFGSSSRPDLTASDPKGTDTKIKKVLGLTYDTFKQLVTIKSVLPFSSSSNSDRRELLEEVLEHGEWDLPHDLTLKQINDSAKESEKLQVEFNAAENEQEKATEHLTVLKARSRDHRSDREETLSQLRAQRKHLTRRIEALKSKEDPNFERLKKKVNKLKAEISGLDYDKNELRAAEKKRETLRVRLRNLDNVLDQARAAKKAVRRQGQEYEDLDKLVGQECPTCKHEITAEHAKSCQKKFQRMMVLELESFQGAIRKTKKWVRKEKRNLREVNELIESLETARDTREEKRHELDEAREGLEKVSSQATRSHGDIKGLEAEMKETLRTIAKEKRGDNPYTELIKEARAGIAKIEARLEEIKEKQERNSTAMTRLKMVKRAFSREGVRSLLLDQFVGVLTDRSNHYLLDISGGTMMVEFSTQKETNKGKSVKEEFCMKVIHLGQTRRYKRCSSGERRRIDLSIMLALSDLLKTRRHRSFNLLWLDEVADPLDDEGCQNLAVLLKKKAAESKMRILIVSFNKALSNLFERQIRVVNEKGTARLDFSKARLKAA